MRPVIRHLKYAVFKVTHKILIQSGVEEIKVELGCGSMGQCLPCTYEALSLSPGLEKNINIIGERDIPLLKATKNKLNT